MARGVQGSHATQRSVQKFKIDQWPNDYYEYQDRQYPSPLFEGWGRTRDRHHGRRPGPSARAPSDRGIHLGREGPPDADPALRAMEARGLSVEAVPNRRQTEKALRLVRGAFSLQLSGDHAPRTSAHFLPPHPVPTLRRPFLSCRLVSASLSSSYLVTGCTSRGTASLPVFPRSHPLEKHVRYERNGGSAGRGVSTHGCRSVSSEVCSSWSMTGSWWSVLWLERSTRSVNWSAATGERLSPWRCR